LFIVVLFKTINMSATTQRTYTKAQKKQARKHIYDNTKILYQANRQLYYERGMDDWYMETLLSFLQSIMECDFKNALKGQKLLNDFENDVFDRLLFGDKEYTSEKVRQCCANIKENNQERKELLKDAMMCDAMFGYWKLSK